MSDPEEGWYPDPDDSAFVRFWDGAEWTEERQPARSTFASRRAKRAEQKARDQHERAVRYADDVATYGRQIEIGAFGGKIIAIYEKGFVRLGGLLGVGNSPYEQLISIEATSDVAKKSGLGRGAAATMTFGLSLASSNKRGDVYLTIVTTSQTRVLRESPPTSMNMKSSKALEAAGNSVIRASMPAESSVPPGSVDTVRSRLQRLQELLEDGLISQQEFDQKRRELIDSL